MRLTAKSCVLALCLSVLPAVGLAVAGPATLAGAAPAGCSVLDTPANFLHQVPTPHQVLGYDLGKHKASDQEIYKYWHAVDAASDRVVTGTFATSWEGRPLPYALVGSPQNLARLDTIGTDINRLREPATSDADAQAIIANTPTILWITANVHGNEPSGGDGVLDLLYNLADRDDCVSRAILGNAIVGLIPTQNPDGRANQVRTNAYAFDMNRDWFARTQPEVAGKLDLLWKYPPQLYVDEHEEGGSGYFFPPDSDPIYHETPDVAYNEIQHLYGDANAAAFQAKGWKYVTYQSGYDLFYQGYGDTVPTTEFGAAGMTYEQGVDAPYHAREIHQFTSALVSVYTGATHRAAILRNWRQIFVTAKAEGARCQLEPNATFNPGNTVLAQVPDMPVCGYFLPGNSAATQLVVRRLQLAHVQVDRLTAPLVVPDYTAYGRAARQATMPAGTYWITMDQAQKHWVQAMLNEDTYVPFPYFYDVSGWSNPLLAGIPGGYTGQHLAASVAPVPLLAQPVSVTLPAKLPRVAIIDQRPGSGNQYQTTGWLQWRLAQDWHVPYTRLTPGQVTSAALRNVDVLLVPNVDAQPTYDQLGSAGRAAVTDWVHAGGRYVGWQGGTVLASSLGLSSVGLTSPTAVSPGALMRVQSGNADNYVMWDSYDDLQMAPGSASVVTSFPAKMFVSGYSEQASTLAGSAVEAVDQVGTGSTTVFSVEPNFRAYTDGSSRLLFAAMLQTPTGSSAVPSVRIAKDTSVLRLARTSAEHVAHERAGRS